MHLGTLEQIKTSFYKKIILVFQVHTNTYAVAKATNNRPVVPQISQAANTVIRP